MFAIGAIVPLVPFLLTAGDRAVGISAALSGLTLFGVGGAMTVLTGRGFLGSALRMLVIGAAAAAITYGVGTLLGVAVS
jgi:VIT1/CCC1 family predicted Fe2+/Mn2+ transporter